MPDETPAVSKERPPCGNCGKPAYMLLGDFPVCIDCKYKHDQSAWMNFVQAATMMNHAEQEMALVTGMPSLSNPIQIPNPPIPPISYNNQQVTVTGGNVGVVNLGNVNEIQVHLQTLTEAGSVDLVEPLKQLTEAILNAQDTDEATKGELIEQVAALTEQASTPPEKRKRGAIKALFDGIKSGADAIASVSGAWGAAAPLLRGHFGL